MTIRFSIEEIMDIIRAEYGLRTGVKLTEAQKRGRRNWRLVRAMPELIEIDIPENRPVDSTV